ncbi:MAG: flagellar type III secretion system pore protein FliP [Bryobacterales bacterium]|nr:flagellar type III secretion system pore protein FliP [Bryobacterales bacterium]
MTAVLPRIVHTRSVTAILRAAAVALLCNACAFAQAIPSPIPGVRFTPGAQGEVNIPLQIVVLLTALVLLPAMVMCLTPFLRLVVVFHFLRQALGTQTTPSNQVLIGMSLFLTLLIMRPVGQEIFEKAYQPYQRGELSLAQAGDALSQPLKTFHLKYTREKDIQLFLEMSGASSPRNAAELPFLVTAPAYVLSELQTSFQIGAVLFLPFLVIDLLVASITLSIGMVQLPPVMVSAPFKILLFVLADGWNLMVGSLMKSFLGGVG